MKSLHTLRLIDRNLFANRQVHVEVEEGICFAEFGRVIAITILFQISITVIEHRVVFGMQGDDFYCHCFHRTELFLCAEFSPGVKEKVARLIAGGIKHGLQGYSTKSDRFLNPQMLYTGHAPHFGLRAMQV